jgi:hypothetical protein
MCFRANGVDATVRSRGHRSFPDAFVNGGITLFEIDCLGSPMLPRHFEAFGNAINRDNAAGAEHPRTLNAELADRPAPPYGNRIAGFDFRIFGRHVTGWKKCRTRKAPVRRVNESFSILNGLTSA